MVQLDFKNDYICTYKNVLTEDQCQHLIDKFEDFNRGIYSGTIGYIDSKNNFDFNVVIRSIIYDQKDHNLSFPVGSAITSESDPSIEYEECIEKLKSVFVF